MEFTDKVLKCADCGQEFAFTASEQKFYSEKGFQNEPKRCLNCRQSKRRDKYDGGGNRAGYGSANRERFDVTCATCGQQTSVPFKPTQNRPVYCNECFAKSKQG